MEITRIGYHDQGRWSAHFGDGEVEFSDGFLCYWGAPYNGDINLFSTIDGRPIRASKRIALVKEWHDSEGSRDAQAG